MLMKSLLCTLGLALVSGLSTTAIAATVPFTEHFSAGSVENWEDTNNDPATWVASGGVEGGGFARTSFNYFNFFSPFGGGPVTHRATGSDGASGGNFIGDWLSDGVGTLSAWVRHDAPEELTFFARIAGAANFPGAVIATTVAVSPNTWTQLSWDIDSSNPLCIAEGGTCASAFANVANLQFGTDAPTGLIDDDIAYHLDIDRVRIQAVPEPGTATLLLLGLVGISRARGKR